MFISFCLLKIVLCDIISKTNYCQKFVNMSFPFISLLFLSLFFSRVYSQMTLVSTGLILTEDILYFMKKLNFGGHLGRHLKFLQTLKDSEPLPDWILKSYVSPFRKYQNMYCTSPCHVGVSKKIPLHIHIYMNIAWTSHLKTNESKCNNCITHITFIVKNKLQKFN